MILLKYDNKHHIVCSVGKVKEMMTQTHTHSVVGVCVMIYGLVREICVNDMSCALSLFNKPKQSKTVTGKNTQFFTGQSQSLPIYRRGFAFFLVGPTCSFDFNNWYMYIFYNFYKKRIPVIGTVKPFFSQGSNFHIFCKKRN